MEARIIGLRVANSGHHLQNVEVIRYNTCPTEPYPAVTNDFVSLTRHIGAPADQVIEVSIDINAGDCIAILGATGDTTMYNPYAPGPFTSEILGVPVVLNRMGMQDNMATSATRDLWIEDGYINRIEMLYHAR